MIQVDEWAEWIDAVIPECGIPTAHLPDEVVEVPFLLGIDSRTVEGKPRYGGLFVSLNFGGEKNKPLTQDQRAYVVESVKYALDSL